MLYPHKMKQSKIEKIIFKIYRELYEASTPSANFDDLLSSASLNELGQKVIDFNSYEISQLDFEKIVKENVKGLSPYYKRAMRTSVLLGCSPKFKKESL